MPESTVGPAPDDDWARAPRRLRDLRARDLVFALVLLVLVLVPFAVALVRAFRDGWVPSGDEANIATRALDVFSRHPPRTGLPSTSGMYGDKISTNHPGPIEFYLIAAPLRLFGMSAGPLLTAAAINAGFGLIALWVFFRRLGLTAMLWAGVVLLAVNWSAGTSVLTDTLSSNMTMYALLGTAVLAWALVDGDLRLLPLTVLVASYAAQQHLAAGLIVAVLAVAVAISLAVQIVLRVRRGDTKITKVTIRWLLAGAAVAVVCWAPVLDDELRSHPGNLTEIVKFARDNTRPTLGFHSGVYQALHAVTPPTPLLRTNTVGYFFQTRLGVSWFVIGFLVIAALVAIAWQGRRHTRAQSRLALVALVLLVAGVINGSNVPLSIESWRVNLYRWTWAAAFLTWIAIGLCAARVGRRLLGQREITRRMLTPRAQWLGPVALLVVAAFIATATVFVSGHDDHNREAPAFALDTRVGAAVLAHVDRRHPVVVVAEGYAAGITVAPYVVFRLVEAGLRVEVSGPLTSTYGEQRRYDPASNPSAIVVSSGTTTLPAAPGTLIATERFSAERTALLDELTAAARGVKVELAPGGRALIDRTYTGLARRYIDALIKALPTEPRTVVDTPVFLTLVVDGVLRSPALDKAKAQRLLDLPESDNTIGSDEQVEIHMVSSAQVHDVQLPGL